MGYAVELYFDSDTEAKLTGLLETLAEKAISSLLLDLGSRPHISLAAFDLVAPERLEKALKEFAHETVPLRIDLAAVGTFPTAEGVVFLAPAVSRELVQAHSRFHQCLERLGLESSPYYRPDRWIPHCTIATDLPAEKVSLAVDECRKSAVFGSGELSAVGLISYRPARAVYTFGLEGRPLR